MSEVDRELTPVEMQQSERLHHAVWTFARNRTRTRLARAVAADVITQAQSDTLMQMWDEDTPYEPLHPDTDKEPK